MIFDDKFMQNAMIRIDELQQETILNEYYDNEKVAIYDPIDLIPKLYGKVQSLRTKR